MDEGNGMDVLALQIMYLAGEGMCRGHVSYGRRTAWGIYCRGRKKKVVAILLSERK